MGTPRTLPYLTALRVVTLVNTSGGGARFLERMPDQRVVLGEPVDCVLANTRFSGALRAYRSLAKSLLRPLRSAAHGPFVGRA